MGYSSFWKVWYILSTFNLDLEFSTDDELKEPCYDAFTKCLQVLLQKHWFSDQNCGK